MMMTIYEFTLFFVVSFLVMFKGDIIQQNPVFLDF